MYFVTIQFPEMRGRLTSEEKETIGRVANQLSQLLHEHDVGSVSRTKKRPDEPASILLSVSNKAFVENEIIKALGDLGVLSAAAVFYEGPDKRALV